MSRVDVIVPCYNYGRFLRECVESVLSQPVDVRVLIIDDASTDDTLEVAAGLASKDSRVEFRRHNANQGHIATYNEGLKWSMREYTVLLSADDMLAPGALMRAVHLLDAHPGVGFVYGNHIRFRTKDSLPEPQADPNPFQEVMDGNSWLEKQCKQGLNYIASPEVVVRTHIQHKLGGYRPELPHSGDLEMWLRFAAHASVGYINAVQAYYRTHSNNMHLDLVRSFLDDFKNIGAAYDTFFTNYSRRIINPEQKYCLARHTISEEALERAYEAFHKGDLLTSRGLYRFATKIYPEISRTRLHSRLTWMIRIGPRTWRWLRRLTLREPRRTVPSL